jgi:hypothetical protein
MSPLVNPFTKAQWEKIIACVSTPSSSPPFPSFDRVALLMVVNQYLENIKEVELEPAKRIEHWRKIEAKAAELRALVCGFDDVRDEAAWHAYEHNFNFRIKTSEFLSGVEYRARLFACAIEEKKVTLRADPLSVTFCEIERSRMVLYRELFALWTSRCGALEYERRDGEVGGPLIRYMKAVLDPLLGKVSKETIRSQIDREKELRAAQVAALPPEAESRRSLLERARELVAEAEVKNRP